MLPRRERLRKRLKHLRNRFAMSTGPARAVFVFGDMRSGTNMLKECFYRTPRTAVFNESDPEAFDDFMLRELPVIERLVARSPAALVVFKSLADSARAVELLDHFEGSTGIWIYRRYQDVVNSAVRTTNWRSPLENLRITVEDPERARWRRLNLSDTQLELLRSHYQRGIDDNSARALIWYVRNDLYFSQQLEGDPRVALVNYEMLVESPEDELRRAWAHVGLDLDRRHHEHVSRNSVGRHAEPRIDPEIATLADDMMRRLDDARARQAPAATSASDRDAGSAVAPLRTCRT